MDRSGLFVDAAYVLAQAGRLLVGTSRRHQMQCDFEGIYRAILETAGRATDQPLLRTYWYDAAPHAQPTPEQRVVAAIPRVKLRLGRLTDTGQKGVDSKITRDLMVLARERAIDTAILVTGDDDLREAVLDIQDLGLQVVLAGVAGYLFDQSEELVNAADEHLLLDLRELAPHFSGGVSGLFPRVELGGGATPEAVALACAEAWWTSGSRRDLARGIVLRPPPALPQEVDRDLMRNAVFHLGHLAGRDDLKARLRSAFAERVVALRDA